MNSKNFIVGGLVGGIVNFLLGWLFYGNLFAEQLSSNMEPNLVMIFLGCMSVGFFMSYIFNKWAGVNSMNSGLTAGAIFGLFNALIMAFFTMANHDVEMSNVLLEGGVNLVTEAVMGLCMGFVAKSMG